MTKYAEILKDELVKALGCTEPIAVALLASRFADAIEEEPTEIKLRCSGNIIKNVKSVLVPNTGGLKGLEVATLAGVVSKNWQAELEVLNNLSEDDIKKIKTLLKKDIVKTEHLDTPAVLHIQIEGRSKNNTAFAELIHTHTNIVKLIKNGKVIFEKPFDVNEVKLPGIDRSCLNVKDILNFADKVKIDEVSEVIKNQIDTNMKIANEGFDLLNEKSITKVLLKNACKTQGVDINNISTITKARVKLASAIETRMLGFNYPVVANSGSGTQGLCVSIPVIVFAREAGVSEEKMIRALLVSNLLANHQKTGIGKLSAFCGAVSATTAAMAAVAYMFGYGYKGVSKTMENSLATIAGMVCDGAKVSCAAKAIVALGASHFAYEMAINDIAFSEGEGVVKDNIENTISAVGVLANKGMKETDKVLLNIILE